MKPLAVLLLLLAGAVAEERRGDLADAPPSTPQQQLAMFKVPPGFEVQLVADETQIQKPMNLTFDAAGRLWVTGSELYPWPAKTDVNGEPIAAFQEEWDAAAKQFRTGDKAPQPSEHGKDSLRVLSDFGPDGRARKIEVFADKLNIPIGVQPLPRKPGAKGDSTIVYSIPNIWLFTDTDGDGRADKNEVLYSGFGFKDTHGMSSNYLYWIDGWIYGCHGFSNHSEVRDRAGNVTVLDSGNTYRFRPDGSKFEIYSHGQTNPFGLAVDPLGNFYTADSHSKPVYLVLRGGYYEGIGKKHDGLGFAPRIMDHDHGSSSIAGVAYYAAEDFPKEYWGNTFNGNPVTRRINRDRYEWHGSTPKAIEMPDFLTCDDPWFRPVQVKLGPDGALWIADFYNPIIGHYEMPLTDPRRDHTRGRIWRVVWKGESASNAEVPGSPRVSRGGEGVPPSRTSAVSLQTNGAPLKTAPQEVRPGETPERPRETRTLPGLALPNLTRLDAAALVQKLADANLVVRILATNELADRLRNDALPALHLKSPAAKIGLALLGELPESEAIGGVAQWQELHVLWAQSRIAPQDVGKITSLTTNLEPPVRSHVVAIQGNQPVLDATHANLTLSGLAADNRSVQRAVVALLAARAHHFVRSSVQAREAIEKLLHLWRLIPADDAHLIYQTRVALREVLTRPGAYAEATNLIESDARFASEIAREPLDDDEMIRNSQELSKREVAMRSSYPDKLAEVSLGATTADAAEFLLKHLSRTNLAASRTTEFLKHVALHLPAERLDALASLLSEGRAPARPQSAGEDQGRAGARPSELSLSTRLNIAHAIAQGIRERGAKLPHELAAWIQRVMLEALASADEDVLKRVIESVRETPSEEKYEPLVRIIQDAKRPSQLRSAALEAIANLDRGRAALASALADPSSLTVRKKAAELLGNLAGDASAASTLLAALPTAPWELSLAIAAGLAKHPVSCEALVAAIENGKAPAALLRHKTVAGELQQTAARFPARKLEARAAALTKDLPPEDARLDGVVAKRLEESRAGKPDTARGGQLFQQHCAACHKVKDAGGNLAPNLDGVAARGVHRLLEDILDPNRNVDPAFAQVIIETTDGQTLAGVGLRTEGELVMLNDAQGKPVSVPKAQVKSQTQSRLSLMPPVFEQLLSGKELNDLVGFLLSQ